MCRWVAYRGQPIYLEDVVTKPCHSLIHQSMQASEAKTITNGDGFGVGWYGDRPTPGVYRELRPAWSDENLRAICEQVRSPLFFAHVRASTGTATSRANCHPFTDGSHMFMHNGQVGCYGQIKRRIENLIPDSAYASRAGTTDSEAIFLIAKARARDGDLVAAFEATLGEIKAMMDEQAVCEALRFTAVVTDGQDIHAFRWACDAKAPTLYWREDRGNLFIVSEPLDDVRDHWTPVPQGHVLTATKGRKAEVRPFLRNMRLAA
jgi:predicted glutamine amidotransferase